MWKSSFGIFCETLFECFDFFARFECEVFQVTDDIPVVGVDPELVEAIDARAFRVEPDGPGLGLAEFRAVGVGDKRQREAQRRRSKSFVKRLATLFPTEINACCNIAPLITAPNLKHAIKLIPEVIKIKRLEQHVAEFG